MPTSEEAALEAAAEIVAANVEADAEDPSSETEEENEFPSFDVELPDDLLEDLEAFDPDEEDDDETEEDDDLDDLDTDVAARLRKAEREVKYHRAQRAKEGKKAWKEEAKKYFPFSEPFLDEIQATSHRQFRQKAKSYHDKMRPLVEERVLNPAKASVAAMKAKALADAREEAKAAWGKPPGSSAAPSDAADTQEQVNKYREKKDLAGAIRAMVFPNKES